MSTLLVWFTLNPWKFHLLCFIFVLCYMTALGAWAKRR
jgi:hypothetical protein